MSPCGEGESHNVGSELIHDWRSKITDQRRSRVLEASGGVKRVLVVCDYALQIQLARALEKRHSFSLDMIRISHRS
jgi:hypothetical protein